MAASNAKHNPRRSAVYQLLTAARSRARYQGVPFDLTADDIVIPKVCPILGIPLKHGKGKPTFNSPTLDKIIPALGYVPGNVAVISQRANRIKSDASIHELRSLIRYLERHQCESAERSSSGSGCSRPAKTAKPLTQYALGL
nr:hypothetical protein [uncultured Sphingomonas sp.]